jgi:hypothetical protein
MYSIKDIVRINDILSEYHGVKCVVVKKEKKYYDVETLNTKTRIRVVQEQIIGSVKK